MCEPLVGWRKAGLALFILVAVTVIVLSTSCGAVSRPVVTASPMTHSLTVHVVMGDGQPVPAPLTVRIADAAPNPNAGGSWTTNENGDIGLTLKQGGFTICADPPNSDYSLQCQGVTLVSDQTITLKLPVLIPPSNPVHLDGTTLRFPNGNAFWYQAVTAFDLMARTDEDRDAFLQWAKATDFTAVRVLTMASITAHLPPAQGEAALPSLFDRLRRLHMGAELVLLADSGDYTDGATGHAAYNLTDDQIRAHVRAVAQTVKDHGADLPLLFEIANENAHPSQSRSLQNVAFLLELRGIVRGILPTAPVSLGSTCCGQADTIPAYGSGGDYITLHLDRGRTPFWDEVRRVKDLIDTKIGANQLVVDDEPMGAAEADEPGRRSTNATRFFAQGVLDRFGDLGGTFHCADCIAATVPGPVQRACAVAYIDGATVVGDGDLFQFYNDSTGNAATHGADWAHVQKLFTFVSLTGGKSYLVALNVTGNYAPTWANGWHPVATVDTGQYPGVAITEIAR